jgi:hypothetical protein
LHLRGLSGRALHGAEAGVDSCARSVTQYGALRRVLIVSLTPAADAADLRLNPEVRH